MTTLIDPTTTIPTTTSTGTEHRLGRHAMLRIGGLPIQSLQALRDPRTAAFAVTVLDREDDLAERGARLSDELHEAISRLEDHDLRNPLLGLRRDVFHNKVPRKADRLDDFSTALGEATTAAVRHWIDDRRERDELVSAGHDVAAEELAAARSTLRALADDPHLRPAVLLASASVDKYLDSYRDAGDKALSKRQRRLERSLLEYVYRAGAKTSPFSSFTGVALARLDEDADATAPLHALVDVKWSSSARINVAVVARLAQLIVDNAELRAELPIALTSGWAVEGDRLRYVRRETSTGDDDATVSFDAVRDSLFFLRASGNLARMLALFDQRDTLTYRELVETLAVEADGDEDEYDRYLSVLLRLSLLQVPALQLDIHATDPLRSFRDALDGLGLDWSRRVARDLDPVVDLVAAFPGQDVAGRRRTVVALRAALTEVARSLGDPDATLPQSLVFEDCRAADGTLALSADAVRATVVPSLTELSRILPAVDPMLAHRQLLKGFFLARYGKGGTCTDMLELIQSFHEDIYDQYVRIASRRRAFDDDGYHPLENWLARPEISALDAGRETLAHGVAAIAAATPPGEDVVLDAALVGQVEAAVAPAAPALAPWSFFLQIGAPANGPRTVVLNHAYGGLSFPFSRFVDCLDPRAADRLDEDLRTGLEDVRPTDAVFAEVTGGFVTTNLNLHPRLTDYEIVCPGESSSVPDRARLHLDDLFAEHDVASDRLVLRSRRLGREVVPAYLGYLVPMALPEIPRTLLLFAPTSAAQFDIWSGVPGSAEDGIARRPRTRIGDVVLSRRSWTVDPERLPAPEPGAGELERYLAWRRWQRDVGLPDRVFASRLPAEGEDTAPGDAKPLHVDFASQLSVSLFETVTRDGGGGLVFEEMAPDEDGLWAHSDDGDHVTELVVELTTCRLPMNTTREES